MLNAALSIRNSRQHVEYLMGFIIFALQALVDSFYKQLANLNFEAPRLQITSDQTRGERSVRIDINVVSQARDCGYTIILNIRIFSQFAPWVRNLPSSRRHVAPPAITAPVQSAEMHMSCLP